MRASRSGFTLLELVVVIGIIAALGAIAVVGYNSYVERSRASDIVVKYDALRSGVGADFAQSTTASCADIVSKLDDANLKGRYAQLGIGFEAVSGGFRPVMTVCAKLDTHGAQGVKVAHGAHDTILKTSRVEKNAVLTDTLVSFAAPLTDSERAVCTTAPPATAGACGVPATAQPAQPAVVASADSVCKDDYGATCDADFGAAMCSDPFVAGMCQKYCGLCG